MDNLNQRIANLSPEQRALLEEYLKKQNLARQSPSQQQSLPKIEPDYQNRHLPFPLTDIQEAYWVGRTTMFELGGVSTHAYYEVDTIDLDLAKFEKAWQKLIERHDMLRAIILPEGTQQILKEIPPYKIKILDLTDQPLEVVESKLREIRQSLSHEVLDCQHPPLFQVTATKLGSGKIRLHFSHDALMLDGWSIRIIFKEWYQLYHHLQTELPPLELSFRDYVLALKNLKDSPKYEKAKTYWLERLKNLPPRPELPLKQHPEKIAKPRFDSLTFNLNKAIWLVLKQKGAKENLTPSAILLTAFAEILRLWSKNPQFSINLTFFDRLPFHPQVLDIVGDFTSIVLLGVENENEPTFLAKAKKLQKQLWLDLNYSIFTGVQVLRELVRRQQIIPTALMPIVFTSFLPHANQQDLTHPLIWMGEENYRLAQTPQVWLDHIVSETDGELNLRWNFVPDLFPENMIEAMFEAYCRLLETLASSEEIWQEGTFDITTKTLHPQQPIPLTPEQPQIPQTLLHQLFEQQVALNPQQTAIIAPNLTLTYGQLFERVNKVAHRLRQLGVKPNQLVAVVMEKGWEQVVAVLAILAAGAAYLPLEAELASERVEYILSEGEVSIILSQSFVKNNLETSPERQILYIDEAQNWDTPTTALTAIQKPTDLAYIIYTSGSTGKPKGVMIDHRGAVNTLLDVNQRFKVNSDDRLFALSSLGFDLSVYDIFGILAAGATIVMPEAQKRKDPHHWADLIREYQITIWNSVPTLMALLLEYVEARGMSADNFFSSWRLILLSGDWIPVTLPGRIRKVAPRAEVISLGGATEASIWSILYPIGDVDSSWETIPYGKAMKNQQFYVLNESLAPSPVWVPGNLYIGGVGLSLGYWKNPEKTAQSFIIHPQTGERLYRTGDLGRYLPDGNIEFIGREDFQVKIQGNRVELGEIEAVLRQYPGVKETVIIADGEEHREKRLVAYLVSPEKIETEKVRQFLHEKLPEYMIPHVFLLLEQFPLTPNGKIDRKALPIPSFQEKENLPSLSSTEISPKVTQICRIVAEVLNLETVEANANWLNLGATSIDMIRIANRLDNEWGFRPTIDQLYQRATAINVAELSPIVEEKNPQEASTTEKSKSSVKIILDPEERKQFRASQWGIRRAADKPRIGPGNITVNSENYRRRSSVREFSPEPINQEQLYQFLAPLSQITLNDNPKYLYPSAGGLYPVQTYLFIKPQRVEGIKGGIYYYHPIEQTLVQLSLIDRTLDETIYERLVNRPIYQSSAFALFFIAQMNAIAPLYGELAKDFALIEAGSMLQLLMMEAPKYNLGVCPIGNLDFSKIQCLFDLDKGHLLVHSLLGGQLLPENSLGESNLQEIYLLDDYNEENEREEKEVAHRKQEIITYLENQEELTLKSIHREGNLPLYFAQERMWFVEQLEPDSCVYNIPNAIRMKGTLDFTALEKSINEIIQRHEVFRSSCQDIGGKPFVTILPKLTISLPLQDLSDLSPEEQEEKIEVIWNKDANTPFNLSVAPLLRVKLLRLSQEQHILLLTLHHFIVDGWSMPIFYRELSTLYQAFSRGLPSPYQDFSIQYVDFAFWQRKLLETGIFDQQLSYWKKHLSGSSFLLDLPTDYPRPPVQTYNGSSYLFKLSPELSAAIQKISNQLGVTLFMILLATFQTLLYLYTKQEDFIVATTVSNRPDIHLENLIGAFANNILLRANLANDPKFTDFLEQVKKTTIDAYSNQDYPFEKLVEALNPKRDGRRNLLFQVFFILHQNTYDQDFLLELPEITWTHIAFKKSQSKFDLSLGMRAVSQGYFKGFFEYNADLYSRERIEKMVNHFKSLLEAITSNPNQHLSELFLLNDDFLNLDKNSQDQELEFDEGIV